MPSFTRSGAQRKRRRIAQLARLLFSPVGDGEAAAARAAIQRDAQSLGIDHHDLADAIEAGLLPQRGEADDDDLPDDAEARDLIDELLGDRAARLSDWELRFLDALATQDYAPTPKQRAKLVEIAEQAPQRRKAAR